MKFHHDAVTDRLAAVPLFAACTERELHEISRLATELDVPAGKALVTEGEPGHEFLIVIEGRATATAHGVPIATFGPGDFFGEMALLDNGPRSATVIADTPMHLAVVSQSEFNGLLDTVPVLSRRVLAGLAARIRELDARVF
jgi:CRP/FNR family transcriptional regulator, cyclic AMP receptor protein